MVITLSAACSGTIEGGGGGGDGADAGTEAASLTYASPAPGSAHPRTDLGKYGDLVAALDLAVNTTGAIDRVTFETADGTMLGTGNNADFGLRAELLTDGAHTLVAKGYEGDTVVATAELSVTVEAPSAADCYGWLDLYGVTYERGPSNQGVSDPVTVTTPINGMMHRYVSNTAHRDTFFMDCSLALSLARAAPHLRRRDVIELVDIGVYNYRCIGGGTPPDCPNGISQHAYAKAIDIAGVTTGDGTYYSVNDDWIIDPEGDATCTAATEGDKDEFLHELICALKSDNVWNIVLTPNYNDAHRNHFHVDLTAGSDYIRFDVGGLPPEAVEHAATGAR